MKIALTRISRLTLAILFILATLPFTMLLVVLNAGGHYTTRVYEALADLRPPKYIQDELNELLY